VSKPLPPPLPPRERTAGQVVAESIRLYGHRFWAALALGLPVAAITQVSAGRPLTTQMLVLWAATPLLTAAYVGAVAIASPRHLPREALLRAFGVGLLVFLPVLAWLALFGLAVPAAAHERIGLRGALFRARRLAAADYVHALGSLCALAIVYYVTRLMLLLLLHGQADAATRTASFLADLVISPLLFLGAALLYFDQAARVVDSGSRPRRRRDADLHPAVDAHGSGRPDAEVEP
jgi:predicted DNA repair protein MutK